MNQFLRAAIRLASCSAILLFFSPYSFAEPLDDLSRSLLDSRAAEISKALDQLPDPSVVVCDFFGPRGLTAFGTNLADEFSERLSLAGGGPMHVIDRSQLLKAFQETWIPRLMAGDPEIQASVARQLGAANFVMGHISIENAKIKVSLELRRTSDENRLIALEASLAPTADSVALLRIPVNDASQNGYPLAGMGGYSAPRCVYCPDGRFTEAAVQNKTQGIVLLIGVIGIDGTITNVHVLRGLPDGLSDAAVEALQQWKFTPAAGPDGKPAAVRTEIEMNFRLYEKK